jgi:acyl-CoA thioester hydrolase
VHYYDFEVRISYSETDKMGVIYYANYLIYFERGRTEFLRAIGMRYRDWEEKEQIYLPAMDASVRYLQPGHYDDLLRVRTFLSDLGRASLTFRYEIVLADSGKLIATGETRHPVVNKSWKPVRLPEHLHKKLADHTEN